MIQLANTPSLHATNVTQSVLDLFCSTDAAQVMHRPIPAPEPDPEPNPGPDAAWQISHYHSNIAPADWDDLFRAVQARLEHCVSDALLRTPQLALHDQHALTKAAVLECVEAMTQLHASLALERREWQEKQERQQLQDLQQDQHPQRKEH